MKEKNTKKKTYEEELLWAIIIILIMFITTLDVFWYTRKADVADSTNFNSYAISGVTTITVNKNGGIGGPTKIYYKSGKVYSDSSCNSTFEIDSIEIPAKYGYRFLGYYQSSNQLVYDDGSLYMAAIQGTATGINGDYTITAKWESESDYPSQLITLNKNGGEGGTDYVFHNGSGSVYFDIDLDNDADTIEIPYKEGYIFKGYKYGTTELITSAGKVNSSNFRGLYQYGTSATKGSTYTITAQWESYDEQIVTLNENGGSGGTQVLYVTSSGVYSNSACTTKATKITIPTKAGYAFGGYYWSSGSSSELRISADGTIDTSKFLGHHVGTSSDYMIYAKWTQVTYSVKYNGNGSTSGSMSNSTHTVGTAMKLTSNKYKRTGYKFTGWNTAANGSGTSYTDGQSVTNLSTTNGAVVNLYAQWEQIVFKMTIDNDGGTGGPSALYTSTYVNGTSYSTPRYVSTLEGTTEVTSVTIPTKTGYTFNGYYSGVCVIDSAGKVNTSYYAGPSWQSKKITAQWTANTYTVKYNGNGSTGGSTADSSHTYDAAKALTANGFERKYTVTYNHNYTGSTNTSKTATYTFNGWATSASGAKVYNNSQSVKNLSSTNGATVNLYANWTSASITYIPTRTGYTFVGWYPNKECTVKISDGTFTPTSNMTLYAGWKENTYTIVYDGNGATGGSTANSSHTYDTAKNLTANGYTKTGYAFAGWNTKSDGTGTKYSNNESVKNLATSGTVTLYAQWAVNTYTVSYNYNGATGRNTETSKTVTYGDTYGTLPSPTRAYTITFDSKGGDTCNSQTASWTFWGWYNGSTKVDSTTKVTTESNHTLSASWNGGTISLPTPTKAGYTFGGWTTSDGTSVSNSTQFTANTTLYANWTAGSSEVSFNYNGATGNNGTAKKAVTYNEKYGELPEPTRAYTIAFNSNGGTTCNSQTATWNFGGWYNGSTKVDKDTIVSTVGNHTLTASWSGGTISLPTPTKTGYTFEGWYSESSLTNQVSNSTAYTSNKTLYAKWTANTYTVSYNYNGATGGNSETGKTVTYDSTYGALPSPTRSYTISFDSKGGSTCNSQTATWNFGGWYNGSTKVDSTTKVTTASNHTLTASWNGGTISLPQPTKTGYTFGGWTTSNGTGVSNTTQFTSNTTLYANWTANTYTVSYNYNGATGGNTETSKTVTYDSTYGALSNPTKSYTISFDSKGGSTCNNQTATWNFGGWYNGSSKVDSTSKVTTAANHTLSASWSGGTISLPQPTKTGYTFGGWTTSSGISVGNTTQFTENTTLYAKWTAIVYTVTYNGNGATGGTTTNSSHTYDAAKALTANGYERKYTVTYNHNYTGSTNTSKTATYTFNGWSTTAGGAKVYNDKQDVTNLSSTNGATVTLYANWSSASVNYTPVRTGYIFGGWYKEAACTTKVSDAEYTPTENITVYAKWTPITYTIAYDGNGATGGNTTNSSHTYDAAKELTANGYERKYTVTYNHNYTGSTNTSQIATYKFNGWSTTASGAKVYDDKQSVKNISNVNGSTITLYANWSTSNVNYTPVRAGYTFGGWYKEAACTNKISDATYTPTSDITLYAKWTANTYTLSYNYNGATGGNSETGKTVTYDSTYGALPSPTRSYTITFDSKGGSACNNQTATWNFGGWYNGSTKVDKDTTVSTVGNHTLTASWNGGTISLPTPTREGYTFGGWFSDANLSNSVNNNTQFTSNTTVYAKWTAITYTVTYNGNGATGGKTDNSSHTYDAEKELTANGYERKYTVTYNHNYTGSTNTSKTATYKFNGWSTTADGAKTYNDKQNVTNLSNTNGATVTLYANWSATSVSYAPTREGYIFEGWYKEAACTTKVSEAEYTPTSNITVYAKWTPIAYTVTYNGNGATGGSTANSSHTYDVTKALTSNGYERKYTVTYNHNYAGSTNTSQTATYTFNGWSTTAEGAKAYSDKQSVTNLSSTNGATVTLYAKWNTASVNYAPTREGYIFGGWYKEEACTTKVSEAEYTPTSNITVYAKWTPITYTVTYAGNGATGGNTANSNHIYDEEKALTANGYERKYTVTYNHNYEGSTNTSKIATYTFNGWSTTAEGTKTYSDKQTVKNLSNTNETTVTLYANWSSASVSYTPTREGYIFGGWYKEAACTTKVSEAEYTPTSNITLYAKWTPITYTVTYAGNGATGGNTANSNHIYDEEKALTANGYERKYTVTYNHNYEGSTNTSKTATYTFNGWSTTAEGTKEYGDKQTVKNLSNTNGTTVTLYANWSSLNINYEPTRTGYTFGGWYKEADCTNKVSEAEYTPTSDITLYAKWTANTYTVTYNYNNATENKEETSKTVIYDNTYGTLPAPARNYLVTFNSKGGSDCDSLVATWNFEGWYNENTKVDQDTKVTTASDHTLTANWTGGTISLPTPIREGYTFGGWYTEEQCTNKVENSKQYTSDITLYAKWTANTYTITYDSNKPSKATGTITGTTANSNHTYDEAKVLTANGYTLTGWTFAGWNTKADGTGIDYTNGESVKNLASANGTTVILYAKWTANTYTVKYNSNKPSNSLENIQGTTADSSHTYDETKALNKNGYTLTGWTFVEWNTKADGTGTSYNNETDVINLSSTNGATVILYAKWTANKYTVTYNYNNATAGNSVLNKQVTYNYEYGELPTPTRNYTVTFNSKGGNTCEAKTATWNFEGWYKDETPITAEKIVSIADNHTINAKWTGGTITLPSTTRTGYIFKGWYSDEKYENEVTNSTQITSNTTLYAKWEAIKYTVKYNSNKPETASSVITGATADSVHTYDEEKSLTKNGYSLTGWTFTGWNTVANGTGTGYSDEASVVNQTATNGATITLYAQWKANRYTVTYDKNNATEFDGEISKTVTYDTEYGSLPSVKREYTVVFAPNGGTDCAQKVSRYTFEGWYLGENRITSTDYVRTPNDHQLKAKWSGGEIELPTTIKEGGIFVGWYNENGEKVGEAGDTYAPTSDETLFAHYIGKEYTLTVNPNGGKWKDKTEPQEIIGRMDDTIVLDNPVAPDGYKVVFVKNNGLEDETVTQTRTFLGWELNSVGSLNGNQYTYGAGNSEVIAQYSTNDSIKLPTAEKQGYTFEGWYSDVDLNTKIGNAEDNYVPEENTILYAKWLPNTSTEYKVEYYTEKLDGSYELNNTENLTGTTDSNVIAEIKEIAGFEYDENNTENVKQGMVKPDGSLTLKMYYTRKIFTVTLDVNEGNTLENNTKQIKYEAEYGELPEPTKEGHTFIGWYDSKVDGNQIKTTTKLEKTEDHILYAHWKVNTYTLTINPNGGEYNGNPVSSTYTQDYNSTKEIENPTKNKDGYKVTFVNIGGEAVDPIVQTSTFTSWSLDGAGKIEKVNGKTVYTYGAKDTVITANYTGNNIKLPNATKVGYSLKGWKTINDVKVGEAGDEYLPTSDITLYAIYEENFYDLKIDPNGGKWNGNSEVQTVTGKYGSSYVIADPEEPQGYTVKLHYNNENNDTKVITQTQEFDGWENDNGYGTLIGKTYKYGAGTDTLKAKYSRNPVELPNATKTGYTFNGWYRNSELTDKIGDAGYLYSPENDCELYAKWTANTYKITFNVNEGEELENNTKNVVYAEKYGELPTPKRAGYTFLGWYNSVSERITAESVVSITSDSILTAKWTESEFTVILDVYKGNVNPTSKKVIYNHEYGTLPTPTMEGCEFEGWYDSKEQLANRIIDTSIVRKTEDHTLYAKWKDIQGPKFTYDENNIYEIEVHSEIPEFNVTATDNYDDDVDITITNNINKDVVGTYEYTITATDKAGNTTTEKKQFNVVDTTKPEITVKDDVNSYEMEVHGEKPAFLATATDNYDEHIEVVVTDDIDIHKVGKYTVTFTATDTNGNVAIETREFEVKDTTKPVIAVDDENNEYTMEVHGEKPEFKATAIDNYDDHVDVEITDDINVDVVGTYTIVFKAIDTNGNVAVETREFKVVDTTKPVITPSEENMYEMEVHGEKPEFKATATDNYDEHVDVEITDDIDTHKVGTYTITFKSTDTNGNIATVTKEFKVKDTTAPVITPSEENVYEMEVHGEKPEFKATATDNYDDNVNVEITDDINVDKVGTYTVTFKATDTNGNVGTESREFKVKDTTAPVITPSEENVYEMEVHGEKPEFKATATDNYDDNVNVEITDDIDVDKVGTYTITFKATDTNGNVGTESREFKVKDTTAPVITPSEENVYEMEVHGEKPEFKVTATDNYDEHVDVEITDDIDTHKVGTYTITFKSTDTNGNVGIETKEFKVVDTTAPIVTVDDENNVYEMEVHGVKPTFVALATDNYDDHVEVEVTDNIDTHKVGTYTVTFKSTDTNGNVATVTREFNVVDTTAPVITPSEENIYEMEVHGEKPEFKALATDNYDEHVNVEITDDIDVHTVGTYTITFKAIDTNGNVGIETRKFWVKDTTEPVITVDDENNVYEMEVHGEKPEFKALATDNYDEHIEVVVIDNIDIHKVGTYTITFTATDTNGNVGTETREFKVKDTTAPVITPSEENVYEMEVYGEKPEFKALATDNYDIYVEVEITDDINVNKVGTYTVTFTAIDANGNIGTETREFKVKDTTAPIIIPLEENVYEMEVHGEKPEFKAIATDNYDDNITIEITDDIDVHKVGIYTITFKAIDANGNIGTETREFKVKDTTAPIIKLDKNNVYEMNAFEEIPEFKATAIDNYDEEVIVEITNTIDKTNVGTYTVTFTATDKSGNEAKVTKEFKVLKAKPTYTIPTGIEARYIDTLADITLPEGFTFEDDLSTSVGPEGEKIFKVTFTPKDLQNYEIVTGIEIKIKVNYLNIDIDGDGKADLNVDTDGDGKADLNVDTDRDGKADLNVDTDGDGKADLNVDTDGDGKADLNVDIDGDGIPDLNVDTDGDGIPDKNVQKDEDKSDDPTNDEDEDIIYSNEDYTASNTYTKGNLSIYSSKYLFGNKYMENIQNKTTVEALKSWCLSNGTVEVYDKGGMLKKKDTDYVGTGMILKVTKDNETMSFVIVVQGDVSGDGIVTTADAAQVEFHILNKKLLEGAAFRAADINRNKAVTGEDLATIIRNLQYLEPEKVNPDYTENVEDTKSDNTEAADNTENTKEEKINTDSTENKNTTTEEKDTEEKTDTTEDEDKNKTDNTTNKTNTTEQPENIDKKQEEVELPENDTVQYKKQEE